MSEPQADPNGENRAGPDPGAAPLPRASPKVPDDMLDLGNADRPGSSANNPSEADLLDFSKDPFLAPDDPGDDSPTIISKAPRRTERPEDAFAANLRGRQLAHFVLIEPIGVGGMAAVIRAKDTQLDRIVALKILPPDMATDPENIRRFHQEARAAAKLDHENIARVFYCGEDQGLHFIAFEFIEGENLRMILERRGRLPLVEAINYMLQVATGLAHAAARGVVHRDIKPSNIIISSNGRAKLVDMGLARSLEPQARDQKDLTQSGVTLGTFDYISPEQALEPRDADVRSDIYSLGCTFYHMLTGQPPVPEGTAAKKLHHHQYVPPVDPRQLNPEVPDEVAAILARMMAKNPRDRYQRPEQLVQHLIAVAQKLGVADLPEGALFVDAPLPGPPRVRPMVIGWLSAAALVALVILLGSASGPADDPPPPLPVPVKHDPANRFVVPPAVKETKPGTNVVPAVPVKDREVVRTARDLSEALSRTSDHVRIALAADIDLVRAEPSSDNPGLVFEGKELTIEPDPEQPGRRPVIRLAYDALPPGTRDWAILSVRSGKVVLRGLRFEVDAKGTNLLDARGNVLAMTALALAGAAEISVENCEFVQKGLPESTDARHVSAFLIRGESGRAPVLLLKECLFHRGHEVLSLYGTGIVRATNCAIAPQSAVVHVHGPSDFPETLVKLENCSALLERDSTVFHLHDAAGQLQVGNSIFSSPLATFAPDGGVLIRQTGAKPARLTYEVPSRQRNCYHNLRALFVREAAPASYALLEDFRTLPGVLDNDSIEPVVSPWETDGKSVMQALVDDPAEAFRINLRLPFLRQPANPTREVLGVERCTWGRSYLAELPPVDEKPPEIVFKTRLVDPTARRIDRYIYPELHLAVLDSQPGDEILIKHDGLLEVEPVRRERPIQNVTIKPFQGCKPILSIKTNDAHAAMFRLSEGHLQFEGLQFRLEAYKPFKSQAVVAIVGDGQCTFSDCVITLEESEPAWAAVVSLDDPNDLMKVGFGQTPKVFVRNSFIRGEGDLVRVLASRRLDLQVDNSLLALGGTVLVVEGNSKEPPLNPATKISLSRVTAYLLGHLLDLRVDETRKHLVPTEFRQVLDCVFVSGGNKSLVHMDGIDTPEKVMRVFSWSGGRHNVYSGFSQMIDHQPRGEIMIPPVTREMWETCTNEQSLFVMKVAFAEAFLPGVLSRAVPAQFAIRAEGELKEYLKDGDCGANLRFVPTPFGEEAAFPTPSTPSQ
jgi:serine/threonine protein kinase